MTALDGLVEDVNVCIQNFLQSDITYEFEKKMEVLDKSTNHFLKKVEEAITLYKEKGIIPTTDELKTWGKAEDNEDEESNKNSLSDASSIKENVAPIIKTELSRPRTRRNAFREASQSICQASSTKLRKPMSKRGDTGNVSIKKEKQSDVVKTIEHVVDQLPQTLQIKEEKEVMPAPKLPAPRGKIRIKTEVQVKQEKIDKSIRDSDIVLQEPPVTIIDISSSDENEIEETVLEKTKTDVEQNLNKRSRGDCSDDENVSLKRNKSNETEHEAANTVEPANATFVANPNATFVSNTIEDHAMLNATVVVTNPKIVDKDLVPQTMSDLMTDDESEEEAKLTPVKPVRTITKGITKVFSPFEQSPVKQRVKAFEKLNEQVENSAAATRATVKKEIKDHIQAKNTVKEKTKLFTPTTTRFLPPAASTSLKPSKLNTTNSNESFLTGKSASALKASQAEFREREKRRKQKEEEALKKKEALMQAQTEEKKKKREEKQLRAQQSREAMERDKLKVLEQQKLREERHRQLLEEQEVKKQKQREYAEKKRLLAKLKATEAKKLEESKLEEKGKKENGLKLEKTGKKLQNNINKIPIYMNSPTPRLPTDDCLDSDEEGYDQKNNTSPYWTFPKNIKLVERAVSAAGEAIKNTFFSIQAQTPDLEDIFEVIAPQKLVRRSSAAWGKVPRFTMLYASGLESHDETEEFFESD